VTALARWAAALEARAIPEPILAAAPEPPWGFPAELFRRRAELAAEAAPTPTTARALEALPDGGSVLDVGCGSGATSLPLAARARRLVGVDRSADMLAAFRDAAATRGVDATTVAGGWPEAAPRAPACDVVVCGHVLYDVPGLAPFARALGERARRRVVVEITGRHPLGWMADLWATFHGVGMPDGPTADDAAAAQREAGVAPDRADRVERARGGFARREDAVALVRRRLCLPADRDPDVARALGDRLREIDGLWSAGPAEQAVVTLWWPGAAA
jgi:SAM-dependent methyltransferase